MHEKNKKSADVKKMLSDDRFRSMFEDKEFARDAEGAKVSSLYLLTNFSGLPLRRAKRKSHFQNHFQKKRKRKKKRKGGQRKKTMKGRKRKKQERQ